MKLCLKCNIILDKKSLSWPLDAHDRLDAWQVSWHSLALLVVNGVSRLMLPIGLGLAQLKSNGQVYLAYYLWKQGLNNETNLKGYFNAQSCNLFISLHLLWPMKRVIEAHEKCGHFEESPFGSSLECSLLLGLFMGFELEMHVTMKIGPRHWPEL